MINAGVKPNVNASNNISGTTSSTTQSSSSHAANSSSTTQSSSSSSANSSSITQSNNSSSSSSIDYEKGVVNSDGTTNYDAAINQKGLWDGKLQEQGTTSDSFYDTAAQEQWQKDHPNADTIGETYSDGSTSQVPNYAGDDSLYKNNECPQMTQEQLDETNKSMQNKIDPSKTFGNGIQWVSSDYQGEVVGSQTITVDNPVNTPYEDYTEHTAQIDANVVN